MLFRVFGNNLMTMLKFSEDAWHQMAKHLIVVEYEYTGLGYEIIQNNTVSAVYHTAICLSAFCCKIIFAMALVSLRIRTLAGKEIMNSMVQPNSAIRQWEDEVCRICGFTLNCKLVADDEILPSGDRISRILSCQTDSNIVNKRYK